MPIQGSAADIIKVAMIRLSARLKAEGYAARMILQVHDELVLEVPDHELARATALLCEVMEGAYELAAPLKVEANIWQNWAELTPAEEWLSRHA
jgi:DNA polymerase-1